MTVVLAKGRHIASIYDGRSVHDMNGTYKSRAFGALPSSRGSLSVKVMIAGLEQQSRLELLHPYQKLELWARVCARHCLRREDKWRRMNSSKDGRQIASFDCELDSDHGSTFPA